MYVIRRRIYQERSKGMMPIETSKEGTFKRFRDGKKSVIIKL